MAFAAASALKVGIARERILNFLHRKELLAWVGSVREQTKKMKSRRINDGKK